MESFIISVFLKFIYKQWLIKSRCYMNGGAEQIKDKYVLPSLSKYITDVEIPAGTKLRIGEANPLPG